MKALECGVFTLADADMDLKRLLHISEARTDITEALLTIAEPLALVDGHQRHPGRHPRVPRLRPVHRPARAGLDDVGSGSAEAGAPHAPAGLAADRSCQESPPALLSIHTVDDEHPDEDLLAMLEGLASTIRPAIDQYLHDFRQARRVTDLRRAALTDPLTGLGNRRALEARLPVGDYA